MARIGVIHVPLSGHVNPLARLSRVLARAGHDVIAWGHEPYRETIERDGVQMRSLGPAWTGPPVLDWAALGAALARAAADGGIAATADALHAERVDLVVFDSMAVSGLVAAEWLGLPAIGSNAGAWPLLIPDDPAAPPPPTPVPSGSPASEELRRHRETIAREWGVMLSHRDVLDATAERNVAYTTETVVGRGAPEGWGLLGPLLDPVAGVPEDAGDDRPLVFFSLGTVFTEREHLFRVAVEALGHQPVRVLLGTSGRVSPERLGGLPPNVEVTHRVGVQRAILARAAVFVSHCGAGSVHESLAAGVPIAALPQFSDQPVWAGRVAALGAGALVEPQSADALREVVLALLDDPGYRTRAGEVAAGLAAHDGTRIATAVFAEALAEA